LLGVGLELLLSRGNRLDRKKVEASAGREHEESNGERKSGSTEGTEGLLRCARGRGRKARIHKSSFLVESSEVNHEAGLYLREIYRTRVAGDSIDSIRVGT
jgi:hypothetical protein